MGMDVGESLQTRPNHGLVQARTGAALRTSDQGCLKRQRRSLLFAGAGRTRAPGRTRGTLSGSFLPLERIQGSSKYGYLS